MSGAPNALRISAPAASRAIARDLLDGAYSRRVEPYRRLLAATAEELRCSAFDAAIELVLAGHDGLSSLLIMAAVAEVAGDRPVSEEHRDE